MSGPGTETLLEFSCQGEALCGVLHAPWQAARCAVLIVVGGPQTRVGSHRQFVLLARHLAAAGIACLRFDYRGMGDAPGAVRDFEACADDIRAALDALHAAQPGLQHCVLWGLCDGASAAVFQAAEDPRINALILLNPWVRTAALESAALVRHYYLRRLAEAAFWKKLLGGGMNPFERLREFVRHWQRAKANTAGAALAAAAWRQASLGLPERLAAALAQFRGPLLLILSGEDLTAKEFLAAEQCCPALAAQLASARLTRHTVAGANHTFSSQAWRSEVETTCLGWLQQLPPPAPSAPHA